MQDCPEVLEEELSADAGDVYKRQAVLWAFSSYFFIIIAAGHIWKFVTLAYIPPTIAGMVLAYRGKYLS